jgi:hypothetical protein
VEAKSSIIQIFKNNSIENLTNKIEQIENRVSWIQDKVEE